MAGFVLQRKYFNLKRKKGEKLCYILLTLKKMSVGKKRKKEWRLGSFLEKMEKTKNRFTFMFKKTPEGHVRN
jgi:hypothetical protein